MVCTLTLSFSIRDDQRTVERVHKELQARGVKCWMDIHGGMKGDIYGSMAEAVQGAACVVCFMSKKYQVSANCKLELTFAKQRGVPIVPVMMEATGWEASEWLGLVTAGLLWTPLGNGDEFAANTSQLVKHIQDAVGVEMEVEVELEEETVDDTRQELERLRDDDKKPVIGLPSDGDECALSHVIPEASSALVVSDSMHLLVDAVVSADTRRRCGFWGTGGIGKTTTSAWLCRLSRVRRYFNVIAWVALGQTPNLVACQRSLHLQLTGAELPLDISAEEKVEKLRLAFTGRDCLLVLDDVSESATAHSSSGAAHCTLDHGSDDAGNSSAFVFDCTGVGRTARGFVRAG